jgi:hypothetical protein
VNDDLWFKEVLGTIDLGGMIRYCNCLKAR